jgi:hypothetical protein
VWKSARELAVDRERWAVPARCERGYTDQLPDLAVWLPSRDRPGAVIAESGGRREDRQRMILEGWRDAIWSGRYAAMRHDCSSESVARWITRLANKVGLTGSDFIAAVQANAEQIAVLSPAAVEHESAVTKPEPAPDIAEPRDPQVHAAAVLAPPSPEPAAMDSVKPTPGPHVETPEAATARERLYREIFGIREATPNRRWRR